MPQSQSDIDTTCKICDSKDLDIFAHTARCGSCGVLLYYPYPKSDGQLISDGEGKEWPVDKMLDWYSESAALNHSNFTAMLQFATSEDDRNKKLNVLDYGGGGGQFALVCKSHFPESTVHITDISDASLLDEWRPMNVQIPFADLDTDKRTFDIIFLNDVFEHVSDPVNVLRQLAGKLRPNGRIFIDTPKQFWLYPVAKVVSKGLYTKILAGTVSVYHLQIWSKMAFETVVRKAGLKISKYREISEYTMPAKYYLNGMGITNPVLRALGTVFYRNARHIARNKIMCVLTAPSR